MTATDVALSNLDYARAVAANLPDGYKFTYDDVANDDTLYRGAVEFLAGYTGTFSFLLDVRAHANRRGLSFAQAKGVLNCLLADVRKAARDAAPKTVLDVSALLALFAKGGAKLRYPKVTLALDDGTPVTLSLAKSGKNVGAVNVKTGSYWDGVWYGRVDPDGTLVKGAKFTDAVGALLSELAADPVAAAKRFARLTGNCCFCNRPLTDDRSTAAGYGPVCADNYGLPWGKES